MQRIQDIPIPTSVSAVRSVVVNYFRDFIPSLSSYKITLKWFPMTEKAISAFNRQGSSGPSYVQSSNERLLILFIDASTRAIEGVLKFKFKVEERSLVFSYRTRCQSK